MAAAALIRSQSAERPSINRARPECFEKNPPIPGPNGTGIFIQARKTARTITIDDLSADWLVTKAIAAQKTPADIVSEMIQKEISAAQ